MNANQKAALKIVAEMLADQLFKEAVYYINLNDDKMNARDTLQSYGEDGAYEFIDTLNEKIETAMFKIYNKKAREFVAKMKPPMPKTLTINAGPETFESELPRGVHGSLELIKNMTVDKVLDITIENYGEYEENIDGEYTVLFHNGDEIRFDGYFGVRQLLCYTSLTKKVKTKVLKWFKDFLEETVEDMKD